LRAEGAKRTRSPSASREAGKRLASPTRGANSHSATLPLAGSLHVQHQGLEPAKARITFNNLYRLR
jgi:hypothetical protein